MKKLEGIRIFTLFLLASSLAAFTLCAQTVFFPGPELLGRPTANSVTVNVVANGAIEAYFESGLSSGVYTSQTTAVSAAANEPIEVIIDGLKADTQYYYRMVYRRIGASAWLYRNEHSFHTQRARGSNFTFTLIADSHLGQYGGQTTNEKALYQRTLLNALDDHPDFHIDLGDTFAMDPSPLGTGMTEAEADAAYLIERPYMGLISGSVPIFLALGNHENEEGWNFDDIFPPPDQSLARVGMKYRKLYYPNPISDGFYSANVDPLPQAIGGDTNREDYYAWEWGDALFVVLDPFQYSKVWPSEGGTYGGEGTDGEVGGNRWDWTLGIKQYRWLKNTLVNSNARYKFVLSHHVTGGATPYGRGGISAARYFEWGGRNADGTWGWDAKRPASEGWDVPIHQLMVANNVTAYFHGHDHIYAREELDGIVYLEVPKPDDAGYAWQPYGYGYTEGLYPNALMIQNSGHIRVNVSPTGVTGSYVRSYLPGDGTNGMVVDAFNISLPQVTITTNSSLCSFNVDGVTYTTAQTFSWVVGSSHTIATTTAQGSGPTRHNFTAWSDGGAISHTIIVPASATTYTAYFTTQYQLTVAASPISRGAISANPSSIDGFYDSGTSVQLTANPNTNYVFSNWTGALTGTANPQAITMSAPRSVTATFAASCSGSSFTLISGGALNCKTPGVSNTTRAGYAKLAVNSGPAPYGIGVFGFRQNEVIVSEAGVPASPPTTRAQIFIDFRSAVNAVPGNSAAGKIDVNTGIAVVNYSSSTANVRYTLRSISGGLITTGQGTIEAGKYFACFIDRLKDEAASDFVLPPDFQTAIQFGSLEITSTQPLSVMALRATMNQRSEFLITTTPVADLNKSPGADPVYFPQFVDGGGYTTSLILMNTSNLFETGTLEIRNKDGDLLSVNQVGGTYGIQPGGVFRFQTDGSPAAIKAGWVRLVPSNGTPTPVGSGLFSYNPEDVLVSESGIPSAAATTHARIYVDLSQNHNTGLAIASVSGADSLIKISAFEKDGVTIAGASQEPLQLSANGYSAAFADSFITGLPSEFTGVLDISSTKPFAALTLRSLINERHEFLMTTFPVADANAEAPSPIVFPQVADGGGYTTEFILISPGQSASTTFIYYDENGTPTDFGE
jgi:hypothetical protein